MMRAGWLAVVTMMACGGLTTFVEGKSASTATSPAERQPRSLTVEGVVFEDLNANGIRDDGEPPLEDIPVSNGIEILKTTASGEFKLTAKERITATAFVCTPSGWRASRSFYVSADFAKFSGQSQSANFGLVRDPARMADKFCFVQLSDTHVTDSRETIQTMMEDVATVNRLSDTPLFVLVSGDLTNRGTRPEEMRGYLEAIANTKYPFYNGVGNHDYGGTYWDTEHYERILGPRYYSFDCGRYHFISKDIIARERDKPAYERQQKWIEEDLRVNGQGKRVIVFQHYIPTNPELEWWSDHNTAAIFSGHWHGRREQNYKGILDVNSATLRFGGIDRSPRGFRIIHVDGDQLRCEWRVGEQNKHVEVIHPQVNGEVSGDKIDLLVLAYDTAVRVKTVRYRIFDHKPSAGTAAPEPLSEGTLTQQSGWTWSGQWVVKPDAAPGPRFIDIEVTAADGDTWRAEGTFRLTHDKRPAPQAGDDWLFFHNDVGHRGYIKRGPEPPLSMAWAAPVGGTIHIASPVIVDGRVCVGTSFNESLDDCGVVAVDLATGRKLWKTPTDSSIMHSTAAWKDNVLAVSQAGTLYCLDREGRQRWTSPLAKVGNQRWELSFPVTDGRTVFAGRCEGFGAYDLVTGKAIWNKSGGRDWWPNIYSGPSLGANGTVYQGGPFVRALNSASGEELWNRAETAVSTVAVVPAVVESGENGDRLYVFHNSKTLLCLDGKTGNVVWKAKFKKTDSAFGDQTEKPAGKDGKKKADEQIVPFGDETGTPAVGENIVCLGGAEADWPDENGKSAAMCGFDKRTGVLRWRFKVGQEIASSHPYKRIVATITGSPIIAGNVVYFGCNDGHLYALNADTGELLWKYRFGVPIASTPAISGNALIVAAWDGMLYALVGAQ